MKSKENQEKANPKLHIVEDGNKRYFHELPQEEIDSLIADKKPINYIMETYKQPKWCNNSNALEGLVGCWSLMDLDKDGLRTKISEEFCKGCDCFSL